MNTRNEKPTPRSDETNFYFKYTYRPVGASWSTSTVHGYSGATYNGSFPSLAVDAAGGVHMSYLDTILKYAYRPIGGTWDVAIVDPAANVGWYSSMALDASNSVHISYYDYTKGDLKYAYRPCK